MTANPFWKLYSQVNMSMHQFHSKITFPTLNGIMQAHVKQKESLDKSYYVHFPFLPYTFLWCQSLLANSN